MHEWLQIPGGSPRPRRYTEATAHEVLTELVLVMEAAVADATSTREMVEAARAINPDARLIARTRYLREVKPLTEVGADQMIPEEFETSLERFGFRGKELATVLHTNDRGFPSPPTPDFRYHF